MQFTLSFISLLAATASVAVALPQSGGIPLLSDIPILGEYLDLYQRCDAGSPNTYVAMKYQGGIYKTFEYGQCFPYTEGKDLMEMLVFCKPVTCENHPNPDCTGGDVPPIGVPIIDGFTLINVDGFFEIVAQATTCQPNFLPL